MKKIGFPGFPNMLAGNSRDSALDDALGITHCPNSNCSMWWIWEFVPQYCPECNTKVTDTPSQSYETMVELSRKHGLPITVSRCTVCGFEIPCEPGPYNDTCPQCWGELKLITLKGKPVSGNGSSVFKGLFDRIKNCF